MTEPTNQSSADRVDYPDGTGRHEHHDWMAAIRAERDVMVCQSQGTLTWRELLTADVYAAFAETDPSELRKHLIRVAGTAAEWAAAIKRRQPQPEVNIHTIDDGHGPIAVAEWAMNSGPADPRKEGR